MRIFVEHRNRNAIKESLNNTLDVYFLCFMLSSISRAATAKLKKNRSQKGRRPEKETESS